MELVNLDDVLNKQMLLAKKERDKKGAEKDYNDTINQKKVLELFDDFMSNVYPKYIENLIYYNRDKIFEEGIDNAKLKGLVILDVFNVSDKNQKYIMNDGVLIINVGSFNLTDELSDMYSREMTDFFGKYELVDKFNLTNKITHRFNIESTYSKLKNSYVTEMMSNSNRNNELKTLIEEDYGNQKILK